MRTAPLAAIMSASILACGGGNGSEPPAPPTAGPGDGQPAQPGAPVQHVLTVIASGPGIVMSSPPGIDCPGTCTASFPEGTVVTLTGFTPASWTGADCIDQFTCAVTMDADRTVEHIHSPLPALTVRVSGPAIVQSSPTGIHCPGACRASFPEGTVVTLQGISGGQTTAAWAGADCITEFTCRVTMDADRAVEAVFTSIPSPFERTLAVAASGPGIVESSPPGIFCAAVPGPGEDATCTASFPEGTVVTLHATTGRQTSTAWAGVECTSEGTCTVTMDADRAVEAVFTRFDPPPPPSEHTLR